MTTNTYRILAEQPYSLALSVDTAVPIVIGKSACKAFWRPRHADPARQRELGGGLVQLEFTCDEVDLLRAACRGKILLENLFAALTVVTGIPLGVLRLIQIVDLTDNQTTRFLFTVTPEVLHWREPITGEQIASLQKMLLHWDGLPKGNRLRRAASLYRRALGEDDDLTTFQYCYMGLEALEPLLAELYGVTCGAEETTGQCGTCGANFIRKRTVLNGVRAYIRGNDPAERNAGRDREWKLINELRQDQFHSLEDAHDLQANAQEIGPACAHFLHDAICGLSHVVHLTSQQYKLMRGGQHMVAIGTAEPGINDRIEECRSVVEIQAIRWVAHTKYEWVPELHTVHARPGVAIAGNFFWLSLPLGSASEADLDPANFETD